MSQCLLESDNSDLHEQLEEEQTRSDELEAALDDALLSLDELKAEGEAAQNQIRTLSREIANLKVGAPALITLWSLLKTIRPNLGLWKTSHPTLTRSYPKS